MDDNKSSQKEAFGAELKRLSVDVTAKDKQDAMKELDLSRTTVTHYLQGKVLNLDTAASLVLFFRDRIRKRYEIAGML